MELWLGFGGVLERGKGQSVQKEIFGAKGVILIGQRKICKNRDPCCLVGGG